MFNNNKQQNQRRYTDIFNSEISHLKESINRLDSDISKLNGSANSTSTLVSGLSTKITNIEQCKLEQSSRLQHELNELKISVNELKTQLSNISLNTNNKLSEQEKDFMAKITQTISDQDNKINLMFERLEGKITKRDEEHAATVQKLSENVQHALSQQKYWGGGLAVLIILITLATPVLSDWMSNNKSAEDKRLEMIEKLLIKKLEE